jgi:hypothetical protein
MTNLITVLVLTNLVATGNGGQLRERDWQIAANEQYFHGRIEVVNDGGRCDIVTEEYAIEVDWIGKADEGVEQAMRYAAALNKKPAIALIVPKETVLTITNAPCRVWLLE